jgi:hypothetical protein
MMKPVGKPDAGNLHVRFDERGEETERVNTRDRASPRLYCDGHFEKSTPSARRTPGRPQSNFGRSNRAIE